MRSFLGGLGAALVVAAILGCNTVNQPTPPIPGSTNDPVSPEFYTGYVKPIFQKHCFRCHAGINRRGGLSMSTHAGLMKGGRNGQVLVPGDPAASLLVKLIRHEGTTKVPGPMPSKGQKLSDADIATIERWIRAGAIMPPDPPVN